MATVTLSEAARLTGKSRKTIQRYVAGGRLSLSQAVHGEKSIDIAELVRVFGELSHSVPETAPVTMSQAVQPKVTPDVAALEDRIRQLEAQVQTKDAILAAQERHLTSLEQALRLLEGPPKPSEDPPKPRRWWQFGK